MRSTRCVREIVETPLAEKFGKQEVIKEANRLIKNYVETDKARLAYVQSPALTLEDLLGDRLHLSPSGYAKLGAAIRRVIKPMLGDDPQEQSAHQRRKRD